MGTGRGRVWASLLVAAGLLAACGSSEAAEGDGVEAVVTSTTAVRASTSTTVAETTTSRELTEEEVVVQTVADMWQMVRRVSASPDPGDPELEQLLTDPQLTRSRETMAEWQAQGLFGADGPENRWQHRPELIGINGDDAIVADCATDDGWLMRRLPDGSSELVDGSEQVALWTVDLRRVDGVWKVANLSQVETWHSGDPGCVADWS